MILLNECIKEYSALLCIVVHPKHFIIMWGGLSSTTTITLSLSYCWFEPRSHANWIKTVQMMKISCYKNVYELYEKTCCPDTGSCGYTTLSYCSHTWGWMDLSVSCGSNMGLLPWRRGDRNMTEVRFIQSFISEDSHGVIRWNAQTLDISAAGLNTHWNIWLC